MLEASKSKLFEKLFSFYNTNLLKRRFHSFQIKGLANLLERDTSLPLIIYANHSSWWDGLAAFQISQKAKLDIFVMMEEKQLKSLFLFRKLGAFSVDRENNRSAVKSLKYAIKLLSGSNSTLWIFPQGKILPNDIRPFHFYRGIQKIIQELDRCLAVSITFRYEFLNEYKPQLFANIGIPEEYCSENFSMDKNHFPNKTSIGLDELKNDILLNQFDEYEEII